MRGRGLGTIPILIIAGVVIAVIAGYFLLLGGGEGNHGGGGSPISPELIYDDFNDGTAGTNVGGGAGAMSPDGAYDPTISFTADAYEGNYALSIQYEFPSGQWCGYWSFFRSDQGGYDLSDYSSLVFWAKGASGGEKFKIEVKDAEGGVSYKYVTIAGTEWEQVVVPFSDFEQVPWEPAPADFSKLSQVNIVFDTPPLSGTVYLDQIGFG